MNIYSFIIILELYRIEILRMYSTVMMTDETSSTSLNEQHISEIKKTYNKK